MLVTIAIGVILLVFTFKLVWWLVKLPFRLVWGLLSFVLTPLGLLATCLVVAALLL